jgi:hypothetical protein
MAFTSISTLPLDIAFHNIVVEPHRDADKIPGCIAIKVVATGKYLSVDDFGTVSYKDGAGAAERFLHGEGNVLIARRAVGDVNFMGA